MMRDVIHILHLCIYTIIRHLFTDISTENVDKIYLFNKVINAYNPCYT